MAHVVEILPLENKDLFILLIVSNIVDDGLVIQGARPSATRVLT